MGFLWIAWATGDWAPMSLAQVPEFAARLSLASNRALPVNERKPGWMRTTVRNPLIHQRISPALLAVGMALSGLSCHDYGKDKPADAIQNPPATEVMTGLSLPGSACTQRGSARGCEAQLVSLSRISFLLILPTLVLGISLTNLNCLGIAHLLMRPRSTNP